MIMAMALQSWAADAEMLLNTVDSEVQTRIHTQQLNDEWQAEKERLQAKFEELEREKLRLTRQVARQTQAVKETRAYIVESERVIAQEREIAQQLDGYLWDVFNLLSANFNQQLPYLAEERANRLDSLRVTLESPSQGSDDKYRRMMETLLIEAEYGLECETYSQEIMVEDQVLVAEILKVGSLALFGHTADRMFAYDPALKIWQPLERKYQVQVGEAFAIANKEQTVELVRLPLGRIL